MIQSIESLASLNLNSVEILNLSIYIVNKNKTILQTLRPLGNVNFSTSKISVYVDNCQLRQQRYQKFQAFTGT